MPLSQGTWPIWIDLASGGPKHLSKNLVTLSKLLSAGMSGDTHLNTQRIEWRYLLMFMSLFLYIRGVGAMEIVAMDMKLRGMYIARQLSFTGVTFKIDEVPLSQKYVSMYNKSVKLVRGIHKRNSSESLLCLFPLSFQWMNLYLLLLL